MISISRGLCCQLLDDCYSAMPQESCGILLGSKAENHIYTASFTRVTNRSDQPEKQFVMDPLEWTEQWFAAIKNNEEIIGVYHSHPVTPAVPSSEDLTTYWFTLPSYWVISLMNPHVPEVHAYSLYKPTKKKPQSGLLEYKEMPIIYTD